MKDIAMPKVILAAAALLGGVAAAHGEGAVVCGFILNKTGQNVIYSLAVEAGNSRAVEISFQKDNTEVRHPNGGAPYWDITKSPNNGRNYTYAPDPRYIISVAPGTPALVPIGNGQMKAWNAGLFVNGRRVSRDGGFCAVPAPVSTVPSMPPIEPSPGVPETREAQATAPEPQKDAPQSQPAPSGDLGAAFDAYQ